MNQTPKKEPRSGWILYDGSCGFCSWWIPFWGGTLRRSGFDIAPLQSDWVKTRLGLDEADLINDIRLIMPDNSLVSGADVYRQVMKRIWWAWPLYRLSNLPGFKFIFNRVYRAFNKNRFGISKACGLKPK